MVVNKILPEQLIKSVEDRKITNQTADFKRLLDEELKFSKHASERLENRRIELSREDLDKLGSAVKKAQEKGIRNSLVLMNNRAFIVNIKTGTVITAVDEKHLRENVFTNIDGAVII
ncbi:MAG: TIGR02530 family flagellar biosynthesis protein [Thermoanaerobacteraceae bacterium]|nr:TIGR02530 family flagellar biosynthesis protein [Thermoanaerobacteraceae bacterium]